MFANPAKVVQGYTPETTPRRVLLFNPPVYDTRFPWSHWQQPVTLLQLATLFRSNECDLRLVDALCCKPNEKLTRRRMSVFTRGDVSINYWRFGHLSSELSSRLNALKKEDWQPDEVYLEGFTTFWWKGVAESISLIRENFPETRIILCGAYPSLATEHAAIHSGADIIAVGALEGLTGLSLDLSLYPTHPRFTYISIGTDRRLSDDLA